MRNVVFNMCVSLVAKKKILFIIVFLKNRPTSASFSFIFGPFKQTLQFLQQINSNKCSSSIQCRDSNPRPFNHELSPIITRPVHLPKYLSLFICWRGHRKTSIHYPSSHEQNRKVLYVLLDYSMICVLAASPF